ncbi:MAG: Holliday junction resolvase RuvX [Gammaproteobacteria bacterium]|nr:Holliday junction resolvase RuvX [Gammaproteobacteria bacterium]
MKQASGVVIGFDFGYKRIGVAIGHQLTLQARPLPTLQAVHGEPNWNDVSFLFKAWQPDTLIVGLPTHIDGSEQYTTKAARHFSDTLKTKYQLPVFLVDERLTTVDARSTLFSKGGYKKLKRSEVDSFAACVILEQWLQHPTHHLS